MKKYKRNNIGQTLILKITLSNVFECIQMHETVVFLLKKNLTKVILLTVSKINRTN